MFKHILIPTDGSELATAAVDRGVALAAALKAEVTFLTVIEPFTVLTANPIQLEATRGEYEAQSAAHAARVLADCAARAAAAGVASSGLTERSEQPWAAIAEAAATAGCDLIAMASHGRRGMAAVMLGSQTSKVLAQSKLPVLVYR
jgi:nucleotide-binding universal stress UspA family protein